jgi:hypothetical protein
MSYDPMKPEDLQEEPGNTALLKLKIEWLQKRYEKVCEELAVSRKYVADDRDRMFELKKQLRLFKNDSWFDRLFKIGKHWEDLDK